MCSRRFPGSRPCLAALLIATLCVPLGCDAGQKVDSSAAPEAKAAGASAVAPKGNDEAKSTAPAISTEPPPVGATKASGDTEKTNGGSTPVATTTAEPLSAECLASHARIREFHDKLPARFYDAAPGLALRVQEMATQAEAFLSSCESHNAEGNVPYGEIEYFAAKFLYVLSAVRRSEWDRENKALGGKSLLATPIEARVKVYMTKITRLTSSSVKHLPRENKYRPLALVIEGLAARDMRDHASAVKAYELYLADYPEADKEETGKVTAALAAAYRETKSYDKGIVLLEAAVKDLYDSSSYSYFADGLYKLYRRKGDLDGMAKAVERVLTVFPLKLQNDKLEKRTREVLEMYLTYHGFRKGNIQLAQGDSLGSTTTFSEHIAKIDRIEAERAKSGMQIPPAWRIYRDRSRANLRFLEELADRPPPLDLALESGWVTDKRIRLSQAKGKVVPILFRRVGDTRSAPFLEDLGQLCDSDSRLEMITVSYIRSEETVAQEAQEMRSELASLGYNGTAGLDPDVDLKSAFRSFHAMVGSATLLIVDSNGNLAWFQQDPRGIDVNFVKTILERLAATSSG